VSKGVSEGEQLAGWIELDGCFNFRDLGGYHAEPGQRMRAGQVFRADGLQHLSRADLDRLQDEFKLGAVIDLRSTHEIEQDGRGDIAHEPLAFHHVPLFDRTSGDSSDQRDPREFLSNMGELYFLMLSAASGPIARVTELIAESTTPIVFHCAAGKDRTGVISALLLSLLGVPRETLILDYAFSRQNLEKINARLSESSTYQDLMASLPPDAYEAEPATMHGFLDRIASEFGSMREWAEGVGIDAARVGQLRARLLEANA
jgi:protein-tyrosine phosphatase